MSKSSLKWWEKPLALASAPFIIGLLWYIQRHNRRWSENRIKEQERWAAGDRTPWKR